MTYCRPLPRSKGVKSEQGESRWRHYKPESTGGGGARLESTPLCQGTSPFPVVSGFPGPTLPLGAPTLAGDTVMVLNRVDGKQNKHPQPAGGTLKVFDGIIWAFLTHAN